MISIANLDDFMVEMLNDSDFKAFSTELLGLVLDIYVQVDSKYLEGKQNYIYLSNFEQYVDREQNEEIYKSFIDFVIDLKDPVAIDNVLVNISKKEVELLSLKAMTALNNGLKEGIEQTDGKIRRDIRVLAYVPSIYETASQSSIKLVLSLTLGTNKNLGECT